jgi:hypothetical protein
MARGATVLFEKTTMRKCCTELNSDETIIVQGVHPLRERYWESDILWRRGPNNGRWLEIIPTMGGWKAEGSLNTSGIHHGVPKPR